MDDSKVAATVPETDAERSSIPTEKVGRFTIDSLLGAGGMGIVFIARDPVLDRRIALKLIRGAGERAEERFLREAQALAKLTHPNVVTVHEAGTAAGSVYIAMELVDGSNLRTWLATPRSWREIVAAFVAAGRGLVAAHEAGLVHRDFKPENVFVDRNGAVKVGDFGLVHVLGEDATATGMGTPAYMAPEQAAGELVDERADQYAFCKSLDEALANGKGPAWLRLAIARGASPAPSDRWASMAELLGTLERTPRRRRTFALGIGGVLVVAGATTIGALATRGEAAPSCGVDDFAAVWNPATSAELATRFAEQRSTGAATAEHTAVALDAYANRWRATRLEACKHRDTLGDRQRHCLDRVANEARLLIEKLRTADGALVDHAVDRVAGLPEADACASDRLVDAIPVPSDPRVAVIEQLLDEARASNQSDTRRAGHAAAVKALEIATALGHPMLLAEARALAATSTDDTEPAQIQHELELALADAVRANDHHLQAAITLRLFERVIAAGNVNAVEAMLPIARAATAGSTERVHKRNFAMYESQALMTLERYDEALVACDRLAALEDPPYVLAADCRCSAYADRDLLPEATLRCGEALVASEKRFGKGTASTYFELANVGIVLQKSGDSEGALVYRRQALAVLAMSYGPDSPQVAGEHYGISLSYTDLGKFADAKRELELALAVFSRAKFKKNIGFCHLELATVRGALGELDAAADEAAVAVDVLGDALGEHTNVAIAILTQGEAELAAKRLDAALATFIRGGELAEKLGPQKLVSGGLLIGRARALLALGRAKEALAFAERGAAIVEADKTDPRYRALGHATVGRVKVALGDRVAGRAELVIARDAFRAITVGATAKSDLADIERELQ